MPTAGQHDPNEISGPRTAAFRQQHQLAEGQHGADRPPRERQDRANVPVDHERIAAAADAGDAQLDIDAGNALQGDLRRSHTGSCYSTMRASCSA